MRVGDDAVLGTDGLDRLLGLLGEQGYRTVGPVVRDGAVVPGAVSSTEDLPAGFHDAQAPRSYRLAHEEDDDELFGWAVGPGSWKAEFFVPHETLWRARVHDGSVTFSVPPPTDQPVALFGARPCELAALGVLDRVLAGGTVPDDRYAARRAGAFVVVAECGSPSASCFCTSMDTGPGVPPEAVRAAGGSGFDVALTELAHPHRFYVVAATAAGADLLERAGAVPATEDDRAEREEVLGRARRHMVRSLETDGLAALLGRNLEHPRWDEVATRCLSCGNCTLVCPTCFCADVTDVSDLEGTVERRRTWASCFDVDHSFIHGGAVRPTISSRYRQWLTHKLSTWWDQFDTSGCVGCGRCITWCPVGIDITEEAAALRDGDGARPAPASTASGAVS